MTHKRFNVLTVYVHAKTYYLPSCHRIRDSFAAERLNISMCALANVSLFKGLSPVLCGPVLGCYRDEPCSESCHKY